MPVIVRGEKLKDTPIFSVNQKEDFIKKVWGAVENKEGYVFPAYYPFGLLTAKDIRFFSPASEFDDEAKKYIANLLETKKILETPLESFEKLNLPNTFFPSNFKPYDHQKKGILHALHYWRHFYLWEMGSGKTRTIVDGFRLLKFLGLAKKAFVVCPPVVLPTWQREIAKCSQGELTSMIWTGLDSDIIKAEENDFIIMSFARARLEVKRDLNIFNDIDFDVMIVDESHYIGNWDSEQTRAVLYIGAKAKRKFLLSGTAADNPQKLYPQLRFFSSALMPFDYAHYKKQHLYFAENSRYLVTGYKNLDSLNKKVDLIASRVKKSECLDLPPMTIIDIDFHLGTKQKAKYNELIEQMVSNSDTKGTLVIQHGAMRVMKLQQIISGFIKFSTTDDICNDCHFMHYCIENNYKPYTKDCAIETTKPEGLTLREIENPKLQVFEELVNNILESDETNKILCWAYFEEELNDLQTVCERHKIKYVRLDGSTTKNIANIEDSFQNDKDCRVLLGQIKSGIGITLTAANYTIYYSLTWDSLQYSQSLDRNNRPGQTRNMTVYRLLAAKEYETIDRHMAYVLNFKDQITLTLIEKIMCLKCKNKTYCEANKVLPFKKDCIYKSEISRPVTKLTVVE